MCWVKTFVKNQQRVENSTSIVYHQFQDRIIVCKDLIPFENFPKILRIGQRTAGRWRALCYNLRGEKRSKKGLAETWKEEHRSVILNWMRGYRQGLIGEGAASCRSQTWILCHVVEPSPCHPVVRPNCLLGSMKTWILCHINGPSPNPTPNSCTHQSAGCRWTQRPNHGSHCHLPAFSQLQSHHLAFSPTPPLLFWRTHLVIF